MSTSELNGSGPSTKGQGSSMLGAMCNFINTIVGAGIIGLPYAFEQTGVFTGVILLAIVAAFVEYGVRGLITTGDRTSKNSYEALCEKSLGKVGYVIVTVFMFIFAFGAMIAYIGVIGDNVPIVFDEFWPGSFMTDKTYSTLVFSIAFILPLCLLKNMSSLQYSSGVSLVLVVIFLAIVGIRAPTVAKDQDIRASTENNPYEFAKEDLFSGIGVMFFAFVCHQIVFNVYNSMEDKTPEKMSVVIRVSVLISFVLSVALALIGYLSFFSQAESSIFDNFSDEDNAICTARLFLSLTMVFTFPLEAFVARYSVLALFFGDGNYSDIVFYTVSLLVWGGAVAIGMVVSLGITLDITSVISAATLAFLIPSVVLFAESEITPMKKFLNVFNCWKADSECYTASLKERWDHFATFFAPFIMFIFGSFALVYETVTYILDE